MKKNIFIKLALPVVIVLSFGLFAQSALATDPPLNGTQAPPPLNGTKPPANTGSQVYPSLQNPLKVDNIQDLLSKMVDFAIFLGLIVAVLVYIYIGFKFVAAQGNDTALSDAKKWFMYATIGVAILISARVIVDVVRDTFISAGVIDANYFKKP